MIVPKHGMLASARLRNEVAGVRRVMLSRSDGLAMYDDAKLGERDSGAALTATIQGIAQGSAKTLALGSVLFTVTMCDAGCVFVYPVDSAHLLAVVTDPKVDTGRLGDVVHSLLENLGTNSLPAKATS